MSTLYDDSTADLKVRSADGVEFNLHRALLAVNTGAFPGPEVDTSDEIVELSEPGNVLSICFEFVYPRRHPDLEDVKDFKLLAAVAEAVGKYEIFSAINICNVRLRTFMPDHYSQILQYALRHDHSKLVDEAIPYLARHSFTSVLEQVPPSYAVALSRYRDAWAAVFKAAHKHTTSLTSFSSECRCAPPDSEVLSPFGGFSSPAASKKAQRRPARGVEPLTEAESRAICYKCMCMLLKWLAFVSEGIEDTTTLKLEIARMRINGYTKDELAIFRCCSNGGFGGSACRHLIEVALLCEQQMQKIPAFSTFIKNDTR